MQYILVLAALASSVLAMPAKYEEYPGGTTPFIKYCEDTDLRGKCKQHNLVSEDLQGKCTNVEPEMNDKMSSYYVYNMCCKFYKHSGCVEERFMAAHKMADLYIKTERPGMFGGYMGNPPPPLITIEKVNDNMISSFKCTADKECKGF